MHPWLLQLQPGAYEKLDVSSSAIGFTSALLDPASHSKGPAVAAVISPEGGNIRYRCDGTAPTATVGMPVVAGDVVTITGHSVLKAFKAILSTGTTVYLNVQYYHL
jgi:hypothetical protein